MKASRVLTEAGSEVEELDPLEALVPLELEDALEDQLLEDVRPLLAEKKLSAELRLRVSGERSTPSLVTSMILAWPRTPGSRRRLLRLARSPFRECFREWSPPLPASSCFVRVATSVMLVLAQGPEAGGRLDWPSLRTDLKETASGARRALKERPRRTLAWDTPDQVPTW